MRTTYNLKIKLLATITLLAMLPPPALAQDQGAFTPAEPSYHIEMIVFKQNNSSGKIEENWSGHNLELAPAIQADYQLLNKSKLWLNDLKYKLSHNGGYHILAHIAWQQPQQAPANNKGIAIQGGNNLSNQLDPIDATGNFQLTGNAILTKSRFPHLKLNLMLREQKYSRRQRRVFSYDGLRYQENNKQWNQPWLFPTEDTNSRKTNYNTYRLQTSQRLQLNKIQYIDHPLLGILVKVTPQE